MKNFYLSTSILIASLLTGCIELEEDSSTTLNNDTNISDGLTIPDGVEIGNVACTSDHSVAYLSSDLSNEYTTVLRVSDYTSNTIELIENGSISSSNVLSTVDSDYVYIGREDHLYQVGRKNIDTIQKFYKTAVNENSGLFQTDNGLGFSLRDAGVAESPNPYDIGFINDTIAVIARYGKNKAWLVNLNAQQEEDFKLCEIDLSHYTTSSTDAGGNTTVSPPNMFSVNVNEQYVAITMQRLDGFSAVNSAYVSIFDLNTWEEVDTNLNDADNNLKGIQLNLKNPQSNAQTGNDIYLGSFIYNSAYGCETGETGIEKISLDTLSSTTVDNTTCYQAITATSDGKIFAVDNHSSYYGEAGSNTLFEINGTTKTAVTDFENTTIETVSAYGNDLWYSLPQETSGSGDSLVVTRDFEVGQINTTTNTKIAESVVSPTLTARSITFIEK